MRCVYIFYFYLKLGVVLSAEITGVRVFTVWIVDVRDMNWGVFLKAWFDGFMFGG